MSGMAIGFLAGPPVGGALYSRFGFRGPFICGIALSVFDLVGRLLIVERKDALQWGIDPAAAPVEGADAEAEAGGGGAEEKTRAEEGSPDRTAPAQGARDHTTVSLVGVMARLCRSPRAGVVIAVTFLYG
jgi:MFS family permease